MGNRLAPLLQFRLATLLVLVTVSAIFIFANTRAREPERLFFVSLKAQSSAGHWIYGNSFGWPWPYRYHVEMPDGWEDLARVYGFDRTNWFALAGDTIVAIFATTLLCGTTELWLRGQLRRKSTRSPAGRG